MSTSGDGLPQTYIVTKLDYIQIQFSQIAAKLIVDGLQTCSQFPLLRSRKTNTTQELNASPPRVIEHVVILGSTVPGEGQEGCMRRHDAGCFAITESFGDAIIIETTNVAFCNKRLDRCRVGVLGEACLQEVSWFD
jgi:hypothetical protein